MIALLAALTSGILFYLSQGLDNVWALAWLAPLPLLWLAYGKTPLWQVLLASLAAILASAIYALQCYAMLPPVLILAVVGPQALLFPAAVAFARLVHRRAAPIATLFAFPAAWTSAEYLLFSVSPHGSFGSFAYSQVSAPLLIQSASLFGLYGVTFLICLFANTVALALRLGRQAAAAVGIGAAICVLNIVFGVVRLAQPQPDVIRVASIVDESAITNAYRQGTEEAAVQVAETYAQAIRKTGARFAVTPEGGILSKPSWRAAVLAPLVAASRQTNTEIIAGVYERNPSGDLAFAIHPDGTMQSYAKRHLVPMLESEFTPGHGSGWLGNGRAMEICKDMDFPTTIRADAAKGTRLMGVPAGDFGRDGWLHARMAILRGVEGGFALVRAANDGLVTASDAEGRLVARKTVAPKGTTMIVADLPLGPGGTLYDRIGDVFAWLCLALILGIGVRVQRHDG